MTRVATGLSPAASAGRLVSLDVFRGITMAAMVIVNNPGDWGHVYSPLLHAPWNGWTPTDLVFPFFLFIVGVAITLSRRSASTASILKRGAVIFAVGLFLAGFPHFDIDRWRIPGVLQRIALCYVAAALLYRQLMPTRDGALRTPRVLYGVLAGSAAVLMLGYWGLVMLVPVPGGTAGNLSPGADLGAWLDRTLLGGHLWKPTWDPEGLLSTIPAIATTLLGTIAGLWMRSDVAPVRKAAWLAVAGVCGILVGQMWHVVFPINKNLWTSSYVLFTAGGAALFLALCYWAIDVRGWRRWAHPFVVLGMNALALFAFSALLVKTIARVRITTDAGQVISGSRWFYVRCCEPFFAPENASLLYAVLNLALLYLVLLWMYRRKIFLKA